ncbi:MAG: hypothetical protein P1U57_00245 [Oleibacter sp.]|nr:hypothetical protein [Thalassolituus sp.]
MDVKELVGIITLYNHNWKRACEQWGSDSHIAIMLRHRKSDVQVRLLTMESGGAYLKRDFDNLDGEPLFSVRLNSSVTLDNGMVRNDADHIPVRVAEELLSKHEISKFLTVDSSFDG